MEDGKSLVMWLITYTTYLGDLQHTHNGVIIHLHPFTKYCRHPSKIPETNSQRP